MPPWGRPPGARGGKKWKEWERQRQWEEERRFEELDSAEEDDDNGEGVQIQLDPQHQRYASDQLRFTGIDMGGRTRRGESSAYDVDMSSDSDYSDASDPMAVQRAMKQKEDMLIQRALERIRRAQEKGKSTVHLTHSENEALKKHTRRLNSAGKVKNREKKIKSGSGSDRTTKKSSRSSSTALVPAKASRRRNKSSAATPQDSPPLSSGAAPPAFMVNAPSGATYAPLSYYGPNAAFSNPASRPVSRNATAHPQEPYTAPQYYQNQYPQQRYASMPEGAQPSTRPVSSSSGRGPTARMPLPHEDDWTPMSRSRSSSQHSTVDPFQYQTYSPPSPQLSNQYAQVRRGVSGPADMQYSSLRRQPPGSAYAAGSAAYASSSEPMLTRRRQSVESSSEGVTTSSDEGDDDDGDEGVRVDMPGTFANSVGGSGGVPVRSTRRR